jgi:hypothetical protein
MLEAEYLAIHKGDDDHPPFCGYVSDTTQRTVDDDLATFG